MHPLILIGVGSMVVALIAVVIACRTSNGMVRLLAFAVTLIALVPAIFLIAALNPWLTDARFRTYRAFYQDIEVGMSKSEVQKLLAEHYPTNGARGYPQTVYDDATQLGFFMNPEHSREPNCEGIFLSVSNNIVMSKRYSAD
jgi:hypothetical protein